MKNFTCLILITLAIGFSMSAVCDAGTSTHPDSNVLSTRLNVLLAGTVPLTGGAASSVIGTCGAATVAASTMCCIDSQVKTAVSTQITMIKTNLVAFGNAAFKIGKMWEKIGLLVNASTVNTTIDTFTTEASGAALATLKIFTTYTPAMFKTDFANYKEQAPTCFTGYSNVIQKAACYACQPTAGTTLGATTYPGLLLSADANGPSAKISVATCDEWAIACNKVWFFYHKAGWFVQTIGALSKKKDAAYVATFPANNAAIYYGTGTFADIDTAITNCKLDSATATNAACTAANRVTVCQAFASLFVASTDARMGIGRSDPAILNTAAFTSRRLLAAAPLDGSVSVDATGIDLTASNSKVYPPTAAVTLVAADVTSWSDGYVAPVVNATTTNTSTTSNSSTSASTSSANVLIGTIISALFAVALLN